MLNFTMIHTGHNSDIMAQNILNEYKLKKFMVTCADQIYLVEIISGLYYNRDTNYFNFIKLFNITVSDILLYLSHANRDVHDMTYSHFQIMSQITFIKNDNLFTCLFT